MAQLQLREQSGESGVKTWKHRAEVGGAEAQTCEEGEPRGCCWGSVPALGSRPRRRKPWLAGGFGLRDNCLITSTKGSKRPSNHAHGWSFSE